MGQKEWTQKLILFTKSDILYQCSSISFFYYIRYSFQALKNYIFGILKRHVPRTSSLFGIVAGWRPAPLLKIKSFKGIFQGLCKK